MLQKVRTQGVMKCRAKRGTEHIQCELGSIAVYCMPLFQITTPMLKYESSRNSSNGNCANEGAISLQCMTPRGLGIEDERSENEQQITTDTRQWMRRPTSLEAQPKGVKWLKNS